MHLFFRAFEKGNASTVPPARTSSDAIASVSTPETAASIAPSANVTASTASPDVGPSAAPKAQLPSDFNGNAPSQPILGSYPKRAFGPALRSFKPAWYRARPWLKYSVVRDVCFCFP